MNWILTALFLLSCIWRVELLRKSDSFYKKILFLVASNFLFQLECGLEFSTPSVHLRLIFFLIIMIRSNKLSSILCSIPVALREAWSILVTFLTSKETGSLLLVFKYESLRKDLNFPRLLLGGHQMQITLQIKYVTSDVDFHSTFRSMVTLSCRIPRVLIASFQTCWWSSWVLAMCCMVHFLIILMLPIPVSHVHIYKSDQMPFLLFAVFLFHMWAT